MFNFLLPLCSVFPFVYWVRTYQKKYTSPRQGRSKSTKKDHKIPMTNSPHRRSGGVCFIAESNSVLIEFEKNWKTWDGFKFKFYFAPLLFSHLFYKIGRHELKTRWTFIGSSCNGKKEKIRLTLFFIPKAFAEFILCWGTTTACWIFVDGNRTSSHSKQVKGNS